MVLVVGALGGAVRQPLIFASLGPTIYELVEQPQLRSARTYNVIVGHLIALGSSFFALWILHAWAAPKVLSTGLITPARLWAAVIASALTTVLALGLHANQPAALSTTLLVSLGSMQTGRDAGAIIAAIFLVALLGQPVRRIRLQATKVRDPIMKHEPYHG